MEERRRYPRKEAKVRALFRGGYLALGCAQLRDLSSKGLFVETPYPAALHDVVIVNLEEDGLGKELSMRCRVVRSIPRSGMGLEITLASDEALLETWLAKTNEPN